MGGGCAMRFSHLTLPSDWSTWRMIDTRSNNDGGGISLDLGTFGLLAATSGRGGHAADRAQDAPTCPPQLAGVWMLPRQSISPLPLLPLLSAHRSVYTAAVIARSKTASCRLPARPHPPSSILPSISSLPPNIPDAAFLAHVPPLWPVLTTWRILSVSDAPSCSRVPATVKKPHSCPSATHPPH